MRVVFACPGCDTPVETSLGEAHDWRCGQCAAALRFEKTDANLPACAVCGCHELYKKKNFPHGLGLSLLVLAFAGFAIFQMLYMPLAAFGVLIGTALFDGILYLIVGDAIVCYRCHAHHKGFTARPEHEPFEITIGERYRQQRLRGAEGRSQESGVGGQ